MVSFLKFHLYAVLMLFYKKILQNTVSIVQPNFEFTWYMRDCPFFGLGISSATQLGKFTEARELIVPWSQEKQQDLSI